MYVILKLILTNSFAQKITTTTTPTPALKQAGLRAKNRPDFYGKYFSRYKGVAKNEPSKSSLNIKKIRNKASKNDYICRSYKRRPCGFDFQVWVRVLRTIQMKLIQCNLDLVTSYLVTNPDLVTICRRPFF